MPRKKSENENKSQSQKKTQEPYHTIRNGEPVYVNKHGGVLRPHARRAGLLDDKKGLNKTKAARQLFIEIGLPEGEGRQRAMEVVEFLYGVALGEVSGPDGKEVAMKDRLKAAEMIVDRISPAPKARNDENTASALNTFMDTALKVNKAIEEAKREKGVVDVTTRQASDEE